MNLRPGMLILLVALAGCHHESPETQIQKAFEGSIQAIESADSETPIKILSPRFTGPDGMSRDEAKLYLMGLLRQGKIGVTVLSSHIEVHGSQATQTVEMVLTSRTGISLLPQDVSHRLFRLGWERMDGDWRLRDLEAESNS
jgi:hypothetical protein